MEKPIYNIISTCFGIGVGILIGYFLFSPNSSQDTSNLLPPSKEQKEEKELIAKKKIIRDTIKISPTVEKPIEDTLKNKDKDSTQIKASIPPKPIDSTKVKMEDTNFVETTILKDELIAHRIIPVITSHKDTTSAAHLFEVDRQSFSDEILVEFWESPLELTGYILTRNKLKLFGFNPNESISLQLGKKENLLILNTDLFSIQLQKSGDFKSLALQ